MTKGMGALTPLELVIREQPDHEHQIRLCMKKWHKRTTGRLQWPREGTFMAAYCDEVEANIKDHKAGDISNTRLVKKAREREVLRWFRQEGQRQVTSGAQMPVRHIGQNSSNEKHTLSGTTEKEQNQPSAPQLSERLPPDASDTDMSPAGQIVVRPGMKKEVQELKKLSAREIREEVFTDSESSSDVSEKNRKGSVIENRQIAVISLAHRCPTPHLEINRREYRGIERKGQHTDEERRLEHLLEQMTLEKRQKMEKQKAAAEAGRSCPVTTDIHPAPVKYSPPKPTCRSEDQEQVTGCEETLQLSGITTNSCMDNVCRQVDYIEDTLHSLKNQQEDGGLNQSKSNKHSEHQQESLSRRRRKTQEPIETRRMTLRSGKVLI